MLCKSDLMFGVGGFTENAQRTHSNLELRVCKSSQNILTRVVCRSGLGGGGQLDATVADDSTVALYSTFATIAFFSGTICNKIGIKATLSLGGFGYALYSASFLSYNHTQNRGFVIFAGVRKHKNCHF